MKKNVKKRKNVIGIFKMVKKSFFTSITSAK